MWRRSSRVLEAPPDLVGLGRVGRRRVHEAPSSRDAVGGGGTAPPAPAPASQDDDEDDGRLRGGRPSLARRTRRLVG